MEHTFKCLNCGKKILSSDNSELIHSDACPSCGGKIIKEEIEEIHSKNIKKFGWILVFSVILILLIIFILFTIDTSKRGGIEGGTHFLAGLIVMGIMIVGLSITYSKIKT